MGVLAAASTSPASMLSGKEPHTVAKVSTDLIVGIRLHPVRDLLRHYRYGAAIPSCMSIHERTKGHTAL